MTVVSVPQPASLILMAVAAGMAVVAFRCRRRA
ncbi:MAG: PEP-CTERM sorting domain-containing protein [Planctomycetota bacterium]